MKTFILVVLVISAAVVTQGRPSRAKTQVKRSFEGATPEDIAKARDFFRKVDRVDKNGTSMRSLRQLLDDVN